MTTFMCLKITNKNTSITSGWKTLLSYLKEESEIKKKSQIRKDKVPKPRVWEEGKILVWLFYQIKLKVKKHFNV